MKISVFALNINILLAYFNRQSRQLAFFYRGSWPNFIEAFGQFLSRQLAESIEKGCVHFMERTHPFGGILRFSMRRSDSSSWLH